MTTNPIRTLPAELTDQEKLTLAAKLAQMNLDIGQLIELKGELPAKIKVLQSDAAKIAREFQDGKTFREVECSWAFDEPEPGLKTLYRDDTGEPIDKESMTLFDIEESETVFKVLSGHPEDEQHYIEVSPEWSITYIKAILPEPTAKIIVEKLNDEFGDKKRKTILIEEADYLKAKKIIKHTLQTLSKEATPDPAQKLFEPTNGLSKEEEHIDVPEPEEEETE